MNTSLTLLQFFFFRKDDIVENDNFAICVLFNPIKILLKPNNYTENIYVYNKHVK